VRGLKLLVCIGAGRLVPCPRSPAKENADPQRICLSPAPKKTPTNLVPVKENSWGEPAGVSSPGYFWQLWQGVTCERAMYTYIHTYVYTYIRTIHTYLECFRRMREPLGRGLALFGLTPCLVFIFCQILRSGSTTWRRSCKLAFSDILHWISQNPNIGNSQN